MKTSFSRVTGFLAVGRNRVGRRDDAHDRPLVRLLLPTNFAKWCRCYIPISMYSKWFDEFTNFISDIQINYQSVGSGAESTVIFYHLSDLAPERRTGRLIWMSE